MIRIEEKPCLKLPGVTSLQVLSSYSPEVIEVMHSLEVSLWHKQEGAWEVPTTSLYQLVDALSYVDDIQLKLEVEKKEVSKRSLSLPYKTSPYDYQLEGIQYGLNHNKWLLLDEMGLGKTLSIIYIAEELRSQEGLQHCLIICGINALKTN